MSGRGDDGANEPNNYAARIEVIKILCFLWGITVAELLNCEEFKCTTLRNF